MNRRRWVLLALVFAAIVINYIDRGNLSVAAPAMMKDFSITPATMGVLLSAFFWTYAAFQIPAGLIVDRFGIRWSYTVGFLVWSLASAAIAISREPGDVIGMRAVLGLAEAIAPLASISFIRSNFSGKEQGLPTSIYIAGQNIGPALGVLVGALLLDKFGWRMMFAITGLGALIWVPCWLLAAPPDSVRAERPAELGIEDPGIASLDLAHAAGQRDILGDGVVHPALVLLLVFCSHLGAELFDHVARLLNAWNGACAFHRALYDGRCQCHCRCSSGQAGCTNRRLSRAFVVWRPGICGNRSHFAAFGDKPLMVASDTCFFAVCDGDWEFHVLDDYSARLAREDGWAVGGVPEHGFRGRRRSRSHCHGLDSRTAKALRPGDHRCRRVSRSGRPLPPGGRIERSRKDKIASGRRSILGELSAKMSNRLPRPESHVHR